MTKRARQSTPETPRPTAESPSAEENPPRNYSTAGIIALHLAPGVPILAFYSPWPLITRLVAVLPLAYAVNWKRNVYLGIVAHCLLNTILTFGALPLILGLA